jgi:hypothetical protein
MLISERDISLISKVPDEAESILVDSPLLEPYQVMATGATTFPMEYFSVKKTQLASLPHGFSFFNAVFPTGVNIQRVFRNTQRVSADAPPALSESIVLISSGGFHHNLQ